MRAACAVIAILILATPSLHAWDLFKALRGQDVVKELPTTTGSSAQPQLFIGEFTGSTGASVQTALRQELIASHRIAVTTEPSGFAISGRSVGGRVVGRLTDPGKGQLFERTYAAPGLDENVKAFSDDIIYALTGTPGLATSRITFVSNLTGKNQIYVCDASGGNIQQVTRDPYGAVSPSLAPDASLLAFTSYQGGFPEVRLMDLAGGMESTVTDTPGNSFGAAFSPDGTHLALVMSFLGNPEIFISDLSTNSAACITETIGIPSSPSWHPDGSRLVYSLDEGEGPAIHVAHFALGKQEAALIRWRTGYSFNTDPEWSPDGSALAFTARSRGVWMVVVKDYPSGKTQLTRKGAQHPSWSPDGRFIIYTEGGDLYRHDLSTGIRLSLITGFGQVTEPRWMR